MTEWTSERRKLAIDHYLAGRSPEWIAQELGTTKFALKMALSRWGVKRGPMGPGAHRKPLRRSRESDDIALLLSRLAAPVAETQHGPPLSIQDRLQAYHDEPLSFLGDFAPVKFLPYQEGLVRAIHGHPYTLLLCGRGIGKSTVAAYYATWFAFTHPGAVILLIGAIERQAAIDFEFVRSFIQAQPILAPSLVEFSQTFVRLTNNAKLFCLPAGDRGDTIRGFHADLIILDEAARCGDEVFAAVLPMLGAMASPRLVMATTPRGMTGFVFNASTNPLWHTVRIKASESSLLTPAYLEDMRRTMPEELYRMEFEAEFVDESTSAFPFSLLDEAEDPDLECDTYP